MSFEFAFNNNRTQVHLISEYIFKLIFNRFHNVGTTFTANNSVLLTIQNEYLRLYRPPDVINVIFLRSYGVFGLKPIRYISSLTVCSKSVCKRIIKLHYTCYDGICRRETSILAGIHFQINI